jgi:hypothetical protein
MEIQLTKTLENQLQRASLILGFKQQEIINRALAFYLESVNSKIEFKNELDSFDQLSDEAFINFEKSL